MAKKNECEHFFDMICDALEEDIDSSFCSELEEHLRECPHCCAQIETMRQTVVFCRKVIDEDVPPNVDKVLWQMLGLEKP